MVIIKRFYVISPPGVWPLKIFKIINFLVKLFFGLKYYAYICSVIQKSLKQFEKYRLWPKRYKIFLL